MFTTQYHLTGKGFSGRAVRVRDLDTSEVEKNLLDAAKTVSQDAPILELKKVEWRNGVKLMITEYSDPCTDPLAEGVKWRKMTPAVLEDIGSIFRPKDIALLESVYRDMNEVTPDEVDAISGKALPVASEG